LQVIARIKKCPAARISNITRQLSFRNRKLAISLCGSGSNFCISNSEWSAILQSADDAFISNASSLEPGRDLHDFVIFADRTPASDASAGRLFGLLKANSVSIDRA
jgi:hypothetical protein